MSKEFRIPPSRQTSAHRSHPVHSLHSRGAKHTQPSDRLLTHSADKVGEQSEEAFWASPKRYSHDLAVYLELFVRARQVHGRVSLQLARRAARTLARHVQRLLNHHLNAAMVPSELERSYWQQLSALSGAIDAHILAAVEQGGLQEKHRFALVALGRPDARHVSGLLPIEFDRKQSEFCLRFYYLGPAPELMVRVAGQALAPTAKKSRVHRIFNRTIFREHIAWYPLLGAEAPQVVLAGEPMEVSWTPSNNRAERRAGHQAEANEANEAAPLADEVRLHRLLARLPAYKEQFRHAWLFLDRDTQADDNAEHLYRYVRKHHPAVNAWFLLREDSHDWPRLKAEGFRLLPFGSLLHRLALLNADHVISSHADPYVAQYLPEAHYGDMLNFEFTFLQHGVITNDLSGWLNHRPIRRLITSAQAERDSIVSSDSAYRYTSREVKLLGLPRHDALLKQRHQHSSPSRIVIMPTWRHSLMGEPLGYTNQRERNPNFVKSGFFKVWHRLLTDERLGELARASGHELVFFPHANLQPYLEEFASPQVTLLGHHDIASIQELFLETAVLITDYSSVAFEVAYLEKPILYYQFDADEVYRGGHFIQPGYFDYHRHGFGPVCSDQESLLRQLAALLQTDAKPAWPYAERMRDFFAFRDGRCCERVYREIAGGQQHQPLHEALDLPDATS